MAGTRKEGGKKGGKRKQGAAGKGRKKGPNSGDFGPALAGGQRLSGASKYLEDVMAIFQGLPGRPMNARQVASTMGVADKDIQEMLHVLMRQEAAKGRLKEVGKGRFMMPEEGGRRDDRRGKHGRDQSTGTGGRKAAVQGTIQITAYGKGFVSVPGEADDIMVPKGQTGTAFWGDTVELGWMRRGRKEVPYVSEVVKRARDLYVVTLEHVKDYAFGTPTSSACTVTFWCRRAS